MKTRKESDSMGPVDVPVDALYGAQTQRAINNFTVSGETLPIGFIQSIAVVETSSGAGEH